MPGIQAHGGKVVVFHGGKPGEGKSFLAQNLAAALASGNHGRVLLYDLDAQGRAEHKIRWNLPPGNTVAEIAGQMALFDEHTIRGYFPSSASGVELATLAESPFAAAKVASREILRSLQLFRAAYDFVIVDGLQGWDPLTLALLDAGHLIFMVCSPDLVGLKQEHADILRYQELKFPAGKINLILNRASLAESLHSRDVEQTLAGYKVVAVFPFEPHATETQNQHADLIRLYPNRGFSKAARALAKHVADLPRVYPEPAVLGTGMTPESLPARSNAAAIKERIHAMLLEHPELKNIPAEPGKAAAGQAWLREKVEGVAASLMAAEAPEMHSREDRERLVREVVDEALGLGPLEELIRDPAVSEIMVIRPDQIYIEKAGCLELTAAHFLNEKQLLTVIGRIVAPLGRRIDESQPFVDARLPDGSRVHAIIPPLALKGPALTIRKFTRRRFSLAELVALGSLTQETADFLQACVQARKNLVIAGGTGSGKTTLLNSIAACIPEQERIITVEDAAELSLPQAHVVTLEARPANIEGRGAVTIRDLVRNCLRMRPDRIVVGECRGGEALDMLQAMNTGHDGSMTTAHANTPKDAIARLETMVLMSGMELPVRAIREQILGAIHLVVQQSRLQDGSRKVTQISEVAGMEDGAIVLKDIFVFKQSGLDKNNKVTGAVAATGHQPAFVKNLAAQGITLDEKIFSV